MVKIVLDTNSLVAARWNRRSSSWRIIDLCVEGAVTAVYTAEIKKENLHILDKVKSPKEYKDRIEKFYSMGKLVKSGNRIRASADESDNRFLEAAVAGKADFVISNDHHLLDLKEYDGIRIIRPGQFTKMIP